MTTPPDPFATPDPAGPVPSGPVPSGPVPPPAPAAYGQQPFGQPPYGQQPFGTAPPVASNNGLGTAALVLGILAVLTGLVVLGGALGVVAIVLGAVGRGRAKRGQATNGGAALAGIILGAFGIALTILVIAAFATQFGKQFTDLSECLDSSGGDQASIQQCQRDFQDQVQDQVR